MLDVDGAVPFALGPMTDGTREPPTARPPLGSWARLYALVCVLAVVVMLILWWFSSRYNLRLPR